MKNPSGKKLEKLVFGMFDQMVEGADKYVTKQGSTWLIFTEDKKWVIEFTKDKTLWFNFNLFQGELDLIGKDCTEERDLIKNWFESRFLNKPKVDETFDNAANMIHHIEDAIQNGVKRTKTLNLKIEESVEDTIENGVKHTRQFAANKHFAVEDTIENGVKNTRFYYDGYNQYVEDTIENGVKDTKTSMSYQTFSVEETIQNGVKVTNPTTFAAVDEAIQNGVK